MNAFRCVRVVARPSSIVPTLSRPSMGCRITAPQRIAPPSSARSISFLAPRRPMLPTTSSSSLSTIPVPGSATPSALSSSETVDLASKISSHPALGAIQIRCGPRDTYTPSHLVRKRRHGFLSRIRTKNGRKTIMRRLKKGRWNLSH